MRKTSKQVIVLFLVTAFVVVSASGVIRHFVDGEHLLPVERECLQPFHDSAASKPDWEILLHCRHAAHFNCKIENGQWRCVLGSSDQVEQPSVPKRFDKTGEPDRFLSA